jgi:hypothetical protein
MNISLDPPEPTINAGGKGSRWIFTTWTINEPAYIQSFDVFKDGTPIKSLSKSNFSYNYTEEIVPARMYIKFNRLYSTKDISILF